MNITQTTKVRKSQDNLHKMTKTSYRHIQQHSITPTPDDKF